MAQKKTNPKSSSARKSRTAQGSRRISFDFSLTGLFLLVLLLVIILIWVFILGLVIGRGYQPEALVPQLAKVLPAQEDSPARQGSKVLRSEQLGFFDELRNKPPEQRPGPRGPNEEKQGQDPALHQDQGTRYAFIFQVAAFQDNDKALEMQKRLRTKDLESFLTKVRKQDTTWFRVLVPFTGTHAKTDSFRSQLAKLGIKHPFVYKKEPLQD